ncbi:signal transduction histidine kinase [Leifsonia sp. AK011]|uniref:sensor histidine kinase n=1 Tax=Leifsonia sp. AK011 TaxID=2723075 RepID=UPI0015CA51AD|nr:HAMP domain-containing sensor histidine kinase [Leifsonia sp. AK011]NYF09077.1 signal transduction histidine kinase [Leifsonia sp. AK011]
MLDRLSVRARITLGSLAVAAVLLVIALVIVRGQVAAILTSADVSLARGDLTSFESDIAANPDEPVDDPGTGVLVLVRDPRGVEQVNTLPHDIDEVVEHRPPTDTQFTFGDDERRTYVVVGRAIDSENGTWALWSARSTSSSEIALEGLDRVLVIGGIVLLLGFGAASWFIATAALRPVQQARDREKQMVSDAAHELRTPLAALKTQLELAHDDFGNAEALASQVRAAETSVDRLGSLASNLLELTRLEGRPGAAPLSEVTTLVDEFTGSVDRARMLALANNVTVDFDVAAAPSAGRYRIDASAFGRVADNLFANAIAAVGRDGTVAATLAERGGSLVLAVADDGPGMPDEFLPHAFDRFTRADSSRTGATGGSGLGLALVRAIARDAGGDATARNTHPGLLVEVSFPKM